MKKKNMDKADKIFFVLALINLILSLLFIISANEIPFKDRLMGSMVMNLGYFIFYFLISKLPLIQLEWLKKNNSENIYLIQKRIIEKIPVISKVFALLILFLFLFSSIQNGQFLILLGILIPFSIYLGAEKLDRQIAKTNQ